MPGSACLACVGRPTPKAVSSLAAAYKTCASTVGMMAELDAVAAEIDDKPELADERRWLSDARSRVAPLVEAWDELEPRALVLPDLSTYRAKQFKDRRMALAQAAEALQVALTQEAGGKTPLAEFLFKDVRVPSLKRAQPPALLQLWPEFEKRLDSSYANRLFNEEDRYRSAKAQAEATRAAGRALEGLMDEPEPLDEDEAASVAQAMSDFVARARVPMAQARALLQAARASLAEE